MKKNLLLLMGALTLAVPVLGLAQDAGTPRTPAPDLRYESAFAGYTPYEELDRADWRAVNDGVGQAARKAGGSAAPAGPSRPAAPSGQPATPSSLSGGGAHPGHGTHGGMK